MVANPDQLNTDGDAQGDACDGDDDGDGVTDAADKCSTTPDAGQVNTDGDAQGDACDGDDDNDGIADGADGCPAGGAGGSGSDTDDDGCHDATEDADDDNDGVSDAGDNCALVANPGQQNADGDTQGDACDADRDGDGIADASDRCPDAGLVVGPDGCLLPTVGLPPVTTPPVRCRVPKLKGKTLGQARRMLKKRHCGLGKVRRPRAVRRGRKLVVAKQRTKAGTIHVAGRRVGLTLAYRRR